MIQVSIRPASRSGDYPYNAVEVDLVGAKFGAVAHATFGDNADVDWYIKAEDIVLVKPEPASAPNSGQPAQPRKDNPPEKKA